MLWPLFFLAQAVSAGDDEDAEIKLLVQTEKIAEARTALKLAPAADKHYQIYFVDTAELNLLEAGLILRLRDKGNTETETTVKFRPAAGSGPPAGQWDGKLEREREWLIGKGENLSYSLKQILKGTGLLTKPSENLALLFSDDQKALVKEISKQEFDPASLRLFGPIAAEVWQWKEPAVDDKVSAELWNLAGQQIFELSRKTKAHDLKTKAEAFAAAFDKRVAVDPDPESKTRRALEYLKRP